MNQRSSNTSSGYTHQGIDKPARIAKLLPGMISYMDDIEPGEDGVTGLMFEVHDECQTNEHNERVLLERDNAGANGYILTGYDHEEIHHEEEDRVSAVLEAIDRMTSEVGPVSDIRFLDNGQRFGTIHLG